MNTTTTSSSVENNADKRGMDFRAMTTENQHVELPKNIGKNTNPPYSYPCTTTNNITYNTPVATLTRQSTAYITVKGIESETSYLERDWPLFALKELGDNAFDFLNDYYPNSPKQDRKIEIRAWLDDSKIDNRMLLRMAVRNSNVDNIQPIFESLPDILNFNFWCSTKRYQHRETCGSLGDGLKRILGMGYASWTNDDDLESSFQYNQWNEPLILRFNNLEYKAFITVDDTKIETEIQPPTKFNAPNFTEIQIALPVSIKFLYDEDAKTYWINAKLKAYYNKYKIAKRQTEFNFIEGKGERGGEN